MADKILVFGAGGVGCIYAALLERGGASVTAVCRTNYAAVKENGLLIRSAKWGHIRTRPQAVRTVSEAASHGPFDYILVCSKAFPGTAALIKDAVTLGKTAIALAQNGIAIENEYAELYPQNTIISGVVYLPTTQVSPGIVEHGAPLEIFELGTFPHKASDEAKAQTKRLSELFLAGGSNAPVHDGDIQERRWNKLSLNASLNPITALTLCDDANFIRSSDHALDMIKNVMSEVGSIAAAAGHPNAVSKESIDDHMKRHVERLETGGKEPSMLVDIRNNRQIEVEAILGNTVRKAEELNVEVPYLKMLYVLAKARDFATMKNDQWKPIATVS
ncbi:unnamed protein product [Zymoseptoria tritici ST99CH_3D7]|uniref:2-dehydropantoate 2-reductase n=1 Tax=Zymoseptoria tritici (strain ST99CH_3D7) TaxID=1276538 RepID=A0A1X7S102_ZYMT9|nr:unnamed protein product [Zymoseptoria tritici ST99CH_3D7]